MNIAKVASMLGELTLLRYFPSDPAARDAIVRLVGSMATDESQVRWLITRMLAVYREWPGPIEMRACFCNRFRPKDGIEAVSEFFDGKSWPVDPTVTKPLALPAPPARELPPGQVSEDSQCDLVALASFRGKNLNAVRRPQPATDEEIAKVKRQQMENAKEKATLSIMASLAEGKS